MSATPPAILVYDSGLGGLSVMEALRKVMPDAPFVYVADTAGFPYGTRSVAELNARADAVIDAAMKAHDIRLCVVACNTLSTLCLHDLRARYAIPFVGTVPAIRTAAASSRTQRFSLLATPRASASEYTADLIRQYASDCVVDRIGAPQLAGLCERSLLGEVVGDEALRAEISPAFFDDDKGRTDTIVLGCTHYPLLMERLRSVAPWEVDFIDPAPAIALQASKLWKSNVSGNSTAYVTDANSVAVYKPVFTRFGFKDTSLLS
jgi:glutamate racemase